MSIQSICKTHVITINKSATLKDVATLMQKKHVGSVIVTETFQGKRIPAGLITDRDLALSMCSSQNPQTIKLESFLRAAPITVSTSEGIYEAVIKMRVNGVKRLPVVDENGNLYGIVTADDLLNLMGEEIYNLSQITDMQIQREKGFRIPVQRHIQM